jgi:4-amino-4-deoxy-L-arabinose transferase-like glycosyltransferase
MKKFKVEHVALAVIFIFFLAFTLYLAFNVKMGISSDSWYHLEVSQKYAETLGIPKNGPDTYKWRDIEHIPYLYFWLNGRILNLNSTSFNFNEAILLRVFNVIYSLFTLVGTYLLAKEFFKKKWLAILPVFLLSNTLMFLFLSSSINYDNMANMFAVFSILFFVRAIKNVGNWRSIFLMLIVLSLGTLTKFTITPLAFILVLLIAIYIIKHWKSYKQGFKGSVLYFLIPICILLALNFGVYGINLIRYQSLTPKCLDVLTYEQCLENGVFVRDNEWIPAEEVRFFDMVFSGERIDPVRYMGLWTWEMAKRIYGIMGDSSLFASNIILPFYLFFFLIALILGILNWKDFSKESKYITYVTVFYLLILLFVQNYNMYLKRGYPTLALQGRYMFPVISSSYVLFVLVLNSIEKKWLKGLIFVSLILLFVIGCIPFFIMNVDQSWFGEVVF